MKLSFRYLSFISFVALLSNFNSPVLAQENWPNRPITMVIPFPPGGVADTVGRPVADALSRSWVSQSLLKIEQAQAVELAWQRLPSPNRMATRS